MHSVLEGITRALACYVLFVATAAFAAESPQLSEFAITETKVDAVTLSVDVESFGAGALACDILAVYGHDGFVYTNRMATGLSSLGVQTFSLQGLKPDTQYEIRLYAENGQTDVPGTVGPLEFTTEAESYSLAVKVPDGKTVEYVATPSTGGIYVDTLYTHKSNTRLEGVFYVPAPNTAYGALFGSRCNGISSAFYFFARYNFGFKAAYELGSKETVDDESFVADQKFRLVVDGQNAAWYDMDGQELGSMTATGTPTDGQNTMFLFAGNGAGIDGKTMNDSIGARIYQVQLYEGDKLVREFMPAVDRDGKAFLFETLYGTSHYPTGGALTAGADMPQFANPAVQDDHSVDERPWLGTFKLSVDALSYDGAMLSATLSRDGMAQADVYACFGETYGGDVTSNWTTVSKVATFSANGARIDAVISPAGARYVRFMTETDGWSETIYLPELSVAVDNEVKMGEFAVEEADVSSATISVNVMSMGGAATSYALFAVYGHGDVVCTNKLADGSTTLGKQTFGLSNLKPDTQYQVYLYAENGIEGGYSQMQPQSFRTAAEGRGTGYTTSLALGETVYDGSTLQADLSREGAAASEIYVCFGAEYGGDRTNDWANVVKLPFAFAENVANLVAAADGLGEAAYVRFFSPTDGWSPSVYLPEEEIVVDRRIKISGFRISEVGVGTVWLSANVTSVGTGATAFDLYAVCGHDGLACTNRVDAGLSPLGTHEFAIHGLLPSTRYEVCLYAENGHEGGFCVTEPLAFTTMAESCPRMVVVPGGKTVEYVETPSTGVYVDTLYTHKSNTRLEGVFYVPAQDVQYGALFGSRCNGVNKAFYFFARFGNSFKAAYELGSKETVDDESFVADQKFRLVVDGQNAAWYDMDGQELGSMTATGTPTDGQNTMFLFAGNGAGIDGKAIADSIKARIYRIRLYEGDVLVRDFVPAIDGEGKGCLFEAQNGTFHYPVGGTLTAGDDAVQFVDSPVQGGQTTDERPWIADFVLSTEALSLDGSVLSAVLSRTGKIANDVYVCYGSSYGEDDTNLWEHVVRIGSFGAGEIAASFYIAAEEGLVDAAFLRFWSPDCGCSRTILADELAPSDGTFRVSGVRGLSATATNAVLTIDVSGPNAGVCDVFAAVSFTYLGGTTARIYATTNLVLRNVGTGTYAVRLAPLCPGAAYELVLFTANADGTHSRLPQEGAFAFATAADAQPESGACTLLVTTTTHKARDGRLDLTVSRPAAEGETVLYAAFGSADGGVDAVAWRRSERIGAFAAGETSVDVPSPAMGPSVKYMRLYTSDGEWSKTILVPATGFLPKLGLMVVFR